MVMRKSLVLAFTIFGLSISACAPGARTPPGAVASATGRPRPSSSAAATQSATYQPEPATPVVTQTITPLPAIPSFTPTLDPRTIVTATPAPKAECPQVNPALVPDFRIREFPGCFDTDTCDFIGTGQEILAYLNSGGSVNSAIARLRKAEMGRYSDYAFQDVTGDAVPDLVFMDFGAIPELNVLVCRQKKYEIYTFDPGTAGVDIRAVYLDGIRDLTGDGIPEILLFHTGCSGSGCSGIFALSWVENGLLDLSPAVMLWGVESYKFPTSANGRTREIVLSGDRPGSCCATEMIPWRYQTVVFGWNGQFFEGQYRYFTPPLYRFQAVQDADRETGYRHYAQALTLYQETIFADRLHWWSPARRQYEMDAYSRRIYPPGSMSDSTAVPNPTPDPTEYPRLAAYAYYRLAILHVYLGEMDAAATQYATLQSKFPASSPGHPYAEMAAAFWDAYQASHRMYDGCAAAIQYAVEHPDILTPLGSDYHGSQSHIYIPADVCPFR